MRTLLYLMFNIFLIGKQMDPLIQASDAINAGSYKNALEYVIIAQKLEPLNPDVYRMKALLHESLGDPKKAIISWEKCILYSNNKDIKSEAEIHIKNLKNEK